MKRFFKDFIDLPKHEFNRKYLLPVFTLAMLLFSIRIGAILFTPLQSLQRVEGTVSTIDSVITSVKNKPLFKQVDKDLTISLAGHEKNFTLSTTADFGYITSKVKVGDHVTIYHDLPFRKWLFGSSREIYQLEKNKTVIVDFAQYKETTQFPFVLLILFTLGFGVYYFYWRARTSR